MAERDVEARLVKGVRKLGGSCFKWVSPGRVGVPDRIVLLPCAAFSLFFAQGEEVKDDGGETSAVQQITLREIRNLGHNVYVLYGADDVDEFLAHAQEAVDFMRRATQ